MISDGEDRLKRLAGDLPQPAKHILDWFHVAMKIQSLLQLAETAPADVGSFGESLRSVKWRLWHGQVDRALDLMKTLIGELADHEGGKDAEISWVRRSVALLEQLYGYIERNRRSVVDYGARHRAGRRIATSLAEASVNAVVAKRFVKKQQMRWSFGGADLLLQVRTAVIDGELRERMHYEPPPSRHDQRLAALFEPKPPLLHAA